LLRACLGAALLLASTPARADDSHYQDQPLGDRAAAMGGAFIALSDEASGAYYNPAGLADAPHSSVSLSASVYGMVRQHTEGHDGPAATDSNFLSYPSTVAWLQRVRRARSDQGEGRVQLGLSLLVPQSALSSRHLEQQGPESASGADRIQPTRHRVLLSEDSTLWVGAAAAWKPLPWLSLGATLFGSVRTGLYQLHEQTVEDVVDPTGAAVDRSAYGERTNVRLSHYGLFGVAGAVFRLTRGLRAGLVFQSPLLRLAGSALVERVEPVRDPGSGNITLRALETDAPFQDQRPLRVGVGLSYSAPGRFAVAADFTLHGPVGEHAAFDHPDTAGLARVEKRLVWQLNVGGELYAASWLPLRLGFFTNRSAMAPLADCDAAGTCKPHENLLADGIDLYGVSGSVGLELERFALNLGLSYARGSGATNVTAGGSGEPTAGVELTRERLFVNVGAAVQLR
jgi:long-chain fatty acid transport protein